MTFKLSWTKFDTLETCAKKYELKYEKKISTGRDQTVFLVGRLVHEVIARWVATGYPADYVQPTMRDALHAELRLLQRVDRAAAQRMARQAMIAVVNAEFIYTKLQFKEHGAIVEERWSLPLPGRPDVPLTGGQDVYDPVTRTIYDLKNYSTESSHADPHQLLTYAVVMRALGRPVAAGAFLYPLRKRWLEPIPITDADIDAQEVRLRSSIDRTRGPFPATVGSHCHFCDFFRSPHCPETERQRATEGVKGLVRL